VWGRPDDASSEDVIFGNTPTRVGKTFLQPLKGFL